MLDSSPRARAPRRLGLPLLAAGSLLASSSLFVFPEPASAHVGETVSHRWALRLNMASKHGRPTANSVNAWKVPVATYKGAYDDSANSPLASALPTPDSTLFTGLRLTVPSEYHPVCVKGATVTAYDNYYYGGEGGGGGSLTSTGYACDTGGGLARIAGLQSTKNTTNQFGGVLGARRGKCVSATVTKSEACYQTDESGYATGNCTATVNIKGVGSWTVPATMDSSSYSIPDLWYTKNVPHWNGSRLCPESAADDRCGSAGAIPGCAYYGMQDAWDKAQRVLPLTQPQIAAVTQPGHETLAAQVNAWMTEKLDAEQIGAGYFSFILSNLKLKTAGTNSDVNTWESVDAEAHWAVYLDNTPADKVGLPGYNSKGSYGQTLVRRLGMEDTARYMYCRYNSGSLEYLPPTWGFEGSGILSCAVWQNKVGLPNPTIISDNIFYDEAVPGSELGLNLNGDYDDVEYAEDAPCQTSEDGCPGPLAEDGPATALVAERVVPAMNDYASDLAILDYVSGQRVTLAQLEGVTGEKLTRTLVVPSGSATNVVGTVTQEVEALADSSDEPIEDLDWAGDYGLSTVKYGMSWNIMSRTVEFPECASGQPIRMSQSWKWVADNSLPLLRWDAHRIVVDPQGAQLVGETKSDSGETGLGELQSQGKYGDWVTSRANIPVPLAAAMWVPRDWLSTAKYLYTEQRYDASAEAPLSSFGSWRTQFYPPLNFPAESDAMGNLSVRAPYFALNPYNYPEGHRRYYEILDARDSDIIKDPLYVPKTSVTLNHAYVAAPYENGSAVGSIYQSRKTFVCSKTEPRTVCVKEEVTQDCKVVDGKEVCTEVRKCVEQMTYDACVESSCRKDYCGWDMVNSGPGQWLVEESDVDCKALPAVKEYADKGWLPPASAHGQTVDETGSALSDYVAAQERAAINEEKARQAAAAAP